MKVLYFIFSTGKASGGHYHSCDQISRSLLNDIKIDIISIGPNPSPILLINPCFKVHLEYMSFKDIFILNKKIKIINSQLNPDIVHFFDTESMNIILPLPAFWNKRVVLTKCGGPSPMRNTWQFANTIINFSYENHSWFSNNNKYNKVNLFHIPNRVNRPDILRKVNHKEIKKNTTFNFVRIARIGGAYEKTLLDTFNLIEILQKEFAVKLYMIGRIQDKERYKYLKNEAENRGLPVSFITDERASKGSDFLYLADCVIGTGRSFMEATSLGLPVLTPAKNSNLPILVTSNNFHEFFKTNFSERNLADSISIQKNSGLISKLINDKSS